MHNDDLPHEVILAVQRALDAHVGDFQGDPFDAPSFDTPFSPIPILNDLFPDGAHLSLDLLRLYLLRVQCNFLC